MKYLKAKYQAWRGLSEHYQELYKVAVGELKFEKSQVASLLSALDEIKLLIDDPLIEMLIDLVKEEYALDKEIHARQACTFSEFVNLIKKNDQP